MLIYEGNSDITNFNGMHNLDEYILRCVFNQDIKNPTFVCPKELHEFLVEAFSELSYLKIDSPLIDKFEILEDDIYLSSVPSFHENNCFLIAFNHKKNGRSYFMSELHIFETIPCCWMGDGTQKKLDSYRKLDNKIAYYNFISNIKLVDKLFERALAKTKEVIVDDKKVLTICDKIVDIPKIDQVNKNKFDKSNYVQL